MIDLVAAARRQHRLAVLALVVVLAVALAASRRGGGAAPAHHPAHLGGTIYAFATISYHEAEQITNCGGDYYYEVDVAVPLPGNPRRVAFRGPCVTPLDLPPPSLWMAEIDVRTSSVSRLIRITSAPAR